MSTPTQDASPRLDGAAVPPAVPHDLMGIAGEDSIALTWEQTGHADFWTVYIDHLDGSPSTEYRCTQRRFEVTDLPRGDHEIGVVSWRDGLHCPGAGVFVMVSVLGAPDGGPPQPDEPQAARTSTSLDVAWDAVDASSWDVRLVTPDWVVEQRVEGVPAPWVAFHQLTPSTLYGVQIRARDNRGAVSRWSVAAWQRTCEAACGHQPDGSQVH